MRHELLECLVRIATKRYGHKIKDSSDCVTALLENQLIPNMPPDAVDPDVFRRERLYNEPVDAVFRAHADALQVIYEIYSNLHPVEGKAHLGIEEWYQLFTDIGMLVGPLCEITARDLRLAFWQSQPVVDDEVKYRHRVTALSYLDFCEALGRLADFASVPTLHDMAALSATNIIDFDLRLPKASVALKKEERRLLALERDCERLQDLHENIEWDTNDQKVQLIKAKLEGKELKPNKCQLTK